MNFFTLSIPESLKNVAEIFDGAGYQCWLVGGAVRDGLLGRKSKDFDLATDAKPQIVSRLFRRTIPTGIKHGTVTILSGKYQFETTTFRSDGSYSNGRHPDQISYSTDINQDLARRDFTINAIAWNLIEHKIFDPYDARKDLKKKIIKAIGNPEERFAEDALRPIRACRFASQLGFRIHQNTLDAMTMVLDKICFLSAERIWEEVKKILLSPSPSIGLRLFLQTGLMEKIFPELYACYCMSQNDTAVENLFDHSLSICDICSKDNLAVRAAALFHEVGKPHVKIIGNNGKIIFPEYDVMGAKITKKILTRYKISNSSRKKITRIIRYHLFDYILGWTDSDVRRFIVRIGLDIWDDILALRIAAALTKTPRQKDAVKQLTDLSKRINGIVSRKEALQIGDLAIDGNILIEELDLPPGPRIGDLLQHLLDRVLENPRENNRKKLLQMSELWLKKLQ